MEGIIESGPAPQTLPPHLFRLLLDWPSGDEAWHELCHTQPQ